MATRFYSFAGTAKKNWVDVVVKKLKLKFIFLNLYIELGIPTRWPPGHYLEGDCYYYAVKKINKNKSSFFFFFIDKSSRLGNQRLLFFVFFSNSFLGANYLDLLFCSRATLARV